MKAEVMFITPELASEMLQRNTNNRDIRTNHVNRIADEMRAGRWSLTHQGIAFNCDGTLIDGQHRLMAIVKSGVPQNMLVVNGASKKSFSDIDTLTAPRSAKDAVKVAGINATSVHATTAKCIAVCGSDARLARSMVSKAVLLDFMQKHFDAIDFAYKHLCSRGTKRGICQASVLAAVARAYYTANRERLIQFCDVLWSGMPSGQDDVAAITLRNHLIENSDKDRGQTGRKRMYCKVERAIQAFLERENWIRCTSVGRELFPIPGEQTVVVVSDEN